MLIHLLHLIVFISILCLLLTTIQAASKRYFKYNLSLLIALICLMAINQLTALPFIIFDWPFRLFVLMFYGLFIIWAAFNYKLLLQQLRANLKQLKDIFLQRRFTSVLAAIVVSTVLLTLSLSFQRLDIDDSYYLGLSSEAISSNSVNSHDPSTGSEEFEILPFYKVQAYEVLIASLSFVSGTPVSVLAHIGIPMIFIPAAIFAIRSLLKEFYDNEKAVSAGVVSYGAALLLSGSSIYLMGNFLLARSWQGKSILVATCLPLLLCYAIRAFQKSKRSDILITLIIIIAAASLNPVVVFLFPPVLLVAFIFSVKKHAIKAQLKSFTLFMIPIVLLAGTLKILSMNFKTSTEDTFWFLAINFDTYNSIVHSFFGSWPIVTILALSLIGGFVFGNRKIRRLYVALIAVWAIALNPLLANFIAQNITTSATYWRLFWLTMPELIVAVAVISLYVRLRGNIQKTVVLLLLASFLLLASKYFLFTESRSFTAADNLHKVPDYIVSEAYVLPRDTKILADQFSTSYIRSLNPDIQVGYSRKYYMDIFLSDSPDRLKKLEAAYTQIANSEPLNKATLDTLNEEGINAVIIHSPGDKNFQFLRNAGFMQVHESDGYVIFLKTSN